MSETVRHSRNIEDIFISYGSISEITMFTSSFNNKEGFFPMCLTFHWVQEIFVSIANDNTYY